MIAVQVRFVLAGMSAFFDTADVQTYYFGGSFVLLILAAWLNYIFKPCSLKKANPLDMGLIMLAAGVTNIIQNAEL